MKIISWNVNGIRSNILDFTKAANKKPRKLDSTSALAFLLKKYNPDIICFQETRLGENNYKLFSDESVTSIFPYQYWSSAKKTGARSGNRYSGTSIWSTTEPDKITYEIPGLDNDQDKVNGLNKEKQEFLRLMNTGSSNLNRFDLRDDGLNMSYL